MKSIIKILLAILTVSVLGSAFMSCSSYKTHPILKLENKTNEILWIVVSTEYPNTYLPTNFDEYNMYCFIETVGKGLSVDIFSEIVTIEDVFDKNPNLVVLIYDGLGYIGENVDFAKRNHCELISYVLTEKELKARNQTITVTEEDIIKYQETHETVPFPGNESYF